MNLLKSILIFLLLLIFYPATAESNPVRRNLEHTFAASVVLSDSDAFTFGISNFNPNNVLDIDNEEIGDAESIDLRQRISVLTVPISSVRRDRYDSDDFHHINTKLSYLRVEQDVDLTGITPVPISDHFEEEVLAGYIGYSYQNQLTENWSLSYGVGTHLLYYRNSYDYNTGFSRNYRPFLDNFLYNTDAWALLWEPNFQVKYRQQKPWGYWSVSSGVNYFSGTGWGEANNGNIGHPENTRWINQVSVYHDFFQWRGMTQSVFANFKRIDLSGDSTEPLDARHYYEVMAGWLITPPFESSLIDNVGIGLSINYGSVLKGGSIVLYFNQE